MAGEIYKRGVGISANPIRDVAILESAAHPIAKYLTGPEGVLHVIDSGGPAPINRYLREDGSFLLREDGSFLLRE